MAKKATARQRNIPPEHKTKSVQITPLKIQLDPGNPRLPPSRKPRSQAQLLELLVQRFKLDELGKSIAATGYIPNDPLIGYLRNQDVCVREGNRRVAALQLLLKPELAPDGYKEIWQALRRKTSAAVKNTLSPVEIRIYADVGYPEVDSYIGFRHVNGILQWPAEEKAKFIAHLVERQRWSYEQIADRIGSYAKHVERHYIAYRMVRQAEASELAGYQYIKFGVLMRALQTKGVSEFLGITYPNDPRKSRTPIPRRKTTPFAQFISWAFGTEQTASVLGDSRNLSKFGKILSSPEAIRYLRTASTQKLERAWQKSGGEHESLVDSLWAAADRLEEAVPTAPDYKEDVDVKSAVEKCVRLIGLVLRDFEDIRKKHARLFCNDRAATKRHRR